MDNSVKNKVFVSHTEAELWAAIRPQTVTYSFVPVLSHDLAKKKDLTKACL